MDGDGKRGVGNFVVGGGFWVEGMEVGEGGRGGSWRVFVGGRRGKKEAGEGLFELFGRG